MKAIVNALTLALLERAVFDNFEATKEFATEFVENNAELFTPLATGTRVHEAAEAASRPKAAAPAEARDFVHGTYVPVVGPDGLTDKQRAALGSVGLCPNCHEPTNDHLPGCAVASGEVPRAITKAPLPPTQ